MSIRSKRQSGAATATSRTRERILAQGLDILSQSGLSGLTFGVLARSVGMSKSGLFAHFKSIEQVRLAVVQYMMEVWKRDIVDPSVQNCTGLLCLLNYFTNWLGWSSKVGLRGGCPLTAAMFELDDRPGPLRANLVLRERQWRAQLENLVVGAIEAGDLPKDTNVAQITWEIWGIYLSHHLSARFLRDETADYQARVAFDRLVDDSRSRPHSERISR